MATDAECKGFQTHLYTLCLVLFKKKSDKYCMLKVQMMKAQNLVAVLQKRFDHFMHFQPMSKKYKPTEVMGSTFVWQVQLCEFVSLLTQSWARSKFLVLSMINKLFLLGCFPRQTKLLSLFIPRIQMTAKYRKTHSKVRWITWLMLRWSCSWSSCMYGCWCRHQACSSDHSSPLEWHSACCLWLLSHKPPKIYGHTHQWASRISLQCQTDQDVLCNGSLTFLMHLMM